MSCPTRRDFHLAVSSCPSSGVCPPSISVLVGTDPRSRQAYLEFTSQQAATAAKHWLDGSDVLAGGRKPSIVYSSPSNNPFRTLPKDAPARGNKDQAGRGGAAGGFNDRGSNNMGGNFGNGYRGRGNFNGPRGGYRNFAGGGGNMGMGFNNNAMGGGFNNNMGGGGGNFGFNRGGMMAGGMRGGPGAMRGGRGGMNNMMGGMGGMGGMPMGGMPGAMPGAMGGMGMMGGGMPGRSGTRARTAAAETC